MAYGILARHRGRITVESEEGRGTTFRLVFPPSDQVAEAVAVTGVVDVFVATSTAPYQISTLVFVSDDVAFVQVPTPAPLTPVSAPVELPPTKMSTLPAVVVTLVVNVTVSELAELELFVFCCTSAIAADAGDAMTPSVAKPTSVATPHQATARERTIAVIWLASPWRRASLRCATVRRYCAQCDP